MHKDQLSRIQAAYSQHKNLQRAVNKGIAGSYSLLAKITGLELTQIVQHLEQIKAL